MTISPDAPIEKPDEDLFGLDPFARAIANSIRGMTAASGTVLALNGQWGSGKSSAINLIRHHLAPDIEAGRIVSVTFNPWWFAGADTLTIAFFQQLERAMGPSLPGQARKALRGMGHAVSAAGQLLGAAANLKAPGLGALVSGVTGLIGRLTGGKRTVEQEHRAISKALAKQEKRFLVIIDDIDRLSPDDALTVFRLVKSVGLLPNVTYVLAFDRELAERAVSERFPSEGPSYLEKIIQSPFDLPPPSVDRLRRLALNGACGIMGEPDEAQTVRFMNVFYDVVAPVMRTPRDTVRLINTLATTWPAVAGEVDRADFMALAALRLAAPNIYRCIRAHPDEVCETESERRRRSESPDLYDQMLGLTAYEGQERQQWRRALRRLFPRLDSMWANTWHTDTASWQRERRICSRKHFDTYFAFSVSEDVMPAEEVRALIAHAQDREYVASALRDAARKVRSNGSTKAALLLEEFTIHAADVDLEKIGTLVSTLFALADELDVPGDRARAFAIGDNNLRLHWLVNRLVTDRFNQEKRGEIYRQAMEEASVAWCCDFAERCIRHYLPTDGERERGEPIVREEMAQAFCEIALEKLRAAAEDASLIAHQRLTSLLFAWKRLSSEGVQEVRRWTDAQLDSDLFIMAMAMDIPSVGWSRSIGFDGMGDRVARRSVRVDLNVYREILDVDAFEARVRSLIERADLSSADREALEAFQAAPRGRHDERED